MTKQQLIERFCISVTWKSLCDFCIDRYWYNLIDTSNVDFWVYDESFQHRKWNRTNEEYAKELYMNWICEDIICILLKNKWYTVKLWWADVERRLLTKPQADADIIILKDWKEIHIEIICDFVRYWDRNWVFHLRDNKLKKVIEQNSYIMFFDLWNEEYFVMNDFSNAKQIFHNIRKKPAIEIPIDRSKTYSYKRKTIKWLSLFSNVWIAETYLKECWVDIVVANELLPDRCRFYKDMYPECNVICGDINNKEVFADILNKSQWVDFIIATPPCQWMSIAWRQEENDPRNSLTHKAVEIINKLQPSLFIIENVPQSLKTKVNWELITTMIYNSLTWYDISFNILDVADYWTPQSRKRSIILWSKIWNRPLPIKQKQITLRDAISHLPSIESWEDSWIPYHKWPKHNDNHIRRMKHTPSGKTAYDNEVHFPEKDWRKIIGFKTTYKRMDWNKPAPTVTMWNGSVSSQNNVHPWRDNWDGTYSDARVLSLKELFIVTWLPESRKPPTRASESLIRKVIWEWIPPKLIAELIKTAPKKPS